MADVKRKTPYDLIGGDEGVRAMIDEFYRLMGSLPETKTIHDMHKNDPSETADKLATYLIGWMGGPQNYNERFGKIVIPVFHQQFDIGAEERDQWLTCMRGALEKSPLEADMITQLMVSFTQMAQMCRTR